MSAARKTFTGGAAVLIIVAVIALAFFFTPWLLMLGLGALHSFIPAVPALGFWACFWIVFVLNILSGIFRGASR